jgi:hypothetical protein
MRINFAFNDGREHASAATMPIEVNQKTVDRIARLVPYGLGRKKLKLVEVAPAVAHRAMLLSRTMKAPYSDVAPTESREDACPRSEISVLLTA